MENENKPIISKKLIFICLGSLGLAFILVGLSKKKEIKVVPPKKVVNPPKNKNKTVTKTITITPTEKTEEEIIEEEIEEEEIEITKEVENE